MNVLLVEDNNVIMEEIRNNLHIIGVNPDIVHIIPRPGVDIVELLPSGDELNKFDLALIDLELYPFNRKVQYDPDDLAGGTKVLPYLRKKAPWLPVIAESRLFSKEAEYFLAIAGSFGFDGHLPNELFISDSFSRQLWDSIYNNAVNNRRKTIFSCDFTSPNNALKIAVDDNFREKLNAELPAWETILQSMFYFGDKISIRQIGDGFSGALTFRTKVVQRNIDIKTDSEWLVKLSGNPYKLTKELNAHTNMMLSGVEYARTVPLLWRGAVVENGEGGLAYQFASSTDVALSKCTSIEEARKLSIEISDMVSRMYSNAVGDDEPISSLINEWFSEGRIKSALEHSQDNNLKENFHNIVNYHRCWIHGDLHLRNILIGDRNVFIDFARSRPGPIALDLAKLSSDILLHLDEARVENFPNLKDEKQPINNIISPILDKLSLKLSLKEGDVDLYNIFLKIFLLIALDFPDINKEAKDWVKRINI